MNYLAHAYLSFGHPEILAGNMISDFIKGKNQYNYPSQVFKGIRLHRSIDTFTDAHPATAAIKAYFKKDYRLYAGAFADVVYDHFLANDQTIFSTSHDLMAFTQQTYASLGLQETILPDIFRNMLGHMRSDNWLYHYRYDHGIEKSFRGLVRRATYLQESERAFDVFLKEKQAMESSYKAFFPDIIKHTEMTLLELFHSD